MTTTINLKKAQQYPRIFEIKKAKHLQPIVRKKVIIQYVYIPVYLIKMSMITKSYLSYTIIFFIHVFNKKLF